MYIGRDHEIYLDSTQIRDQNKNLTNATSGTLTWTLYDANLNQLGTGGGSFTTGNSLAALVPHTVIASQAPLTPTGYNRGLLVANYVDQGGSTGQWTFQIIFQYAPPTAT